MRLDETTIDVLRQNLRSKDYARIVSILRKALPAKDSRSDDGRREKALRQHVWKTLRNLNNSDKRREHKQEMHTPVIPQIRIQWDRKDIPVRVKPLDQWTAEDIEVAAENAFCFGERKIRMFEELAIDDKAAVLRKTYPDLSASAIADYLSISVSELEEYLRPYGLAEDGLGGSSVTA